jgi:hypothetical protein
LNVAAGIERRLKPGGALLATPGSRKRLPSKYIEDEFEDD